MTRGRKTSFVAFAAILGGSLFVPHATRAADAPATAPSTHARAADAIIKDLQETSTQVHQVIPSFAIVGDPVARKEKSAAAMPLLKKLSGLLTELANTQTDPDEKNSTTQQHYQVEAFRIAFGDLDAKASLTADAQGGKNLSALSALILGQWWQSAGDAAAQTKLLNDFIPTAKANAADPSIASTFGMMAQLGATNDAVKKQVIEAVRTNLTGDAAKSLLAEADAEQAMKDLEGKPLIVAGRTSTGGKFSSADWKGKVILIDCWATWCGPCKEEMPRTKKLYADYHAKGLEVLGVDCDSADEPVNSFTKENAMPWPELREESQKDDDNWNPLAKSWHVLGIPTMFLIDRKGILRHVDGREDTENKVKALLAEEGTK